MRIAVIGTGYLGATSAAWHAAWHAGVGVDTDANRTVVHALGRAG